MKLSERFSELTIHEIAVISIWSFFNLLFLGMLLNEKAGLFPSTIFFMFWESVIFIYYFSRSRSAPRSKKREWVNALMFAIIASTVLRALSFEAYSIPTSSMEKSLLVGDYLYVSKLHYGARLPMTPISFPFAHHTMPVTGTPAYLEWLDLPYLRLPGFTQIKNNDVVVFNWPAEKEGRPVDKRENLIKRCMGIAGDTLTIVDRQVFINGVEAENPPQMQFKYEVKTKGNGMNPLFLRENNITDKQQLGNGDYVVPLTQESHRKMQAINELQVSLQESQYPAFPYNPDFPWTADNFGPIYIPKSGDVISLDAKNFPLYERAIREYENNPTLSLSNYGKVTLDGKEITTYRFKYNYYFMMGDNRHNSDDSRYWGFVPEDHIVGKAIFLWMSIDPDRNFLSMIRWNRLFNSIR